MKVYQNGKNLRIVLPGRAFETATSRRSISVSAADAVHLCHDSRVQIAGISPYREARAFTLTEQPVPFRTPQGSFVQLCLQEAPDN